MRKKAFTLIELLVVISIIAILMAILMPTLTMARAAGKQLFCLSNLRQMAIATQSYANEYNGFYPIGYYRKKENGRKIEYNWDFTIVTQGSRVTIQPGLLWMGDTNKKIQQCPSFKGDSNTRYDPYTGYNYNTSYIGHGEKETVEKPAKLIEVRKPGHCALFGDGQAGGGSNKFMRAPWPDDADRFSYRAAGAQGYRHNKKTNVAWCDGHASSQRQLYTETLPEEKRKIENYNKTAMVKIGFLSEDNSAYDLK